MRTIRKFPLGIDSFEKLRDEGSYYIDKTDFIVELLENTFEVNLITRPRRFGKTLMMSMLENFFEISRDSSLAFEGLKISEHKELCESWMNQWPVLFLTFKSVEGKHFEEAYAQLKALISDYCIMHEFLAESEKVNRFDRELFQRFMQKTASEEEIRNSLFTLTRMLTAHYGKQVILLIDEYDVPLAKASEAGYYEDMLDVMKLMLGKALKTNGFLKFAVMTGCLKVAKESIFTGTNNFISDTISGERFNEYFGFTEKDVQKILEDIEFTERREEMKSWYDGYQFGSVEVYCPWDVLNYAAALQRDANAVPESYWEHTSHNGIIRKFISRKDLWREEHINDDFETLMAGGYIIKNVSENLTYDTVHSSADNLWSLLYLTGYLTQIPPSEVKELEKGSKKAALRIPNEEIRGIFKSSIIEWFEESVKADDRQELFEALWGKNEKVCAELLSAKIFETISFYDYKEDFYHAFVAGILSYAGYKVISNREQGEGRSDILVCDEKRNRAIVIEVKTAKKLQDMEEKCREALEQIYDKRYAEALDEEYDEIICYGMSFFKKRCRVHVEQYK